MPKTPDIFPSNSAESYDDKQASADLLDAIRIQFRREMDRSGFTHRFIDALDGEIIGDPAAQLFVAQSYRSGADVRVINAVLYEQRDLGFILRTRKVGEEMHGIRMPAPHFTEQDLELAISQLDELQQLRDSGMISLDSTLSWPMDQSQ